MQHLFTVWQDFANDCRAASHILLLADYDGTLAAIVGRPGDAVLSAGVRRQLQALAGKSKFSAGVISGRRLDELKSLVGIEGIYYSGNHGLEIEGPGLEYVHPQAEAARAAMQALAARLAAALENIAGVIIQEKGLSVSVHYRLVKPDKAGAVTRAVKRITAPYIDKGEIRVYPMKKVWEIRPPVNWDKGKAAAAIAREIKTTLQRKNLLTIYLGDDTTDEDAFKVVRRPSGWSIFVGAGNRASAAGYYLNSTVEVAEFLQRLNEMKS